MQKKNSSKHLPTKSPDEDSKWSSLGAAGSYSGSYVSIANDVDFAFSIGETDFYGGGKAKVLGYKVPPGALIINIAGRPALGKGIAPLLGSVPDWVPWKDEWAPEPIHEIILDWPDMSPPPMDSLFWVDLLDDVVANFKEVYICCTGGIGRTGTTLAAFLIASGFTVEEAVEYVRRHYLKHAIETNGQLSALCKLYSEISGKKVDDEVVIEKFGKKVTVMGTVKDTPMANKGFLGPLAGWWANKTKFYPISDPKVNPKELLEETKKRTIINSVVGRWENNTFVAEETDFFLRGLNGLQLNGTLVGWRFYMDGIVNAEEYKRTDYDEGTGHWVTHSGKDIFIFDEEMAELPV